ncbi:kelch-like protein 40b [Aplysia californica]|uniref:Kelch-like protein 40b n=1 Tax=Aplysia californica TaxID=6500 RepID=A0ABM1ABD2_APLCA|nr:kelch-like protein 40b [Aplysia californica]
MATVDRIARGLLQGMKLQLDRDSFHDFEVHVEGETFRCHRFILSSCSHFFRGLFNSGMKESETDSVVIEEISSETFRDVYEFIYSGRNVVNSENVSRLCFAASHLLIDVLIQECELYLQKNLTQHRCVEVFNLAKVLNSQKLSSLSFEMMRKRFNFIRRTEDFLSLDECDVKQLVACEDLPIDSEDEVLEALQRWCLVDSEKDCRLQALSNLLLSARTCLASSSCLQNLLDFDVVRSNKEVTRTLQEALNYHTLPGSRHNYLPAQAVHREESTQQNVLVVVEPGSKEDEEAEKAEEEKEEKSRVCQVVAFGDFMFGLNTNHAAFLYDLKTGQSQSLPSLVKPGGDYKLVSHGLYIYAIGGDEYDNIERFPAQEHIVNPGSAEWEQIGNLVQPVRNTAVMVVNNSIVVFGNDMSSEQATVVQRFNLLTMRCSQFLDEMPGHAESAVCLRDRDNHFLLQQDGSLWRLVACNDSNLQMVSEGSLWEDNIVLCGAIVCKGELIVLGKLKDPDAAAVKQWKLKENFFFSKVCVLNLAGSGMINTVVPKEMRSQIMQCIITL